MAKKMSEHERILELEQAVPIIWSNLHSLDQKVMAMPVAREAVMPISALTTALASPAVLSNLLFFPIMGFEQTAALAGSLLSRAEDQADDLDLEKDDLPADANIPGGESDNAKESREQIYRDINALADRVTDLLEKSREAKAQAAGAATAGKKFADAKPHIKAAEASFKKAKKALRDLARKKRDIAASPPRVPTKDELKAVRDLVKTAHKETYDDLDHVKLALDAIT